MPATSLTSVGCIRFIEHETKFQSISGCSFTLRRSQSVDTMTQPTTTRRRSTTLTAVLSSFFYNESVDVTLSPLTCARASEQVGPDSTSLLSSDPHDRSAMMARLRTFKYAIISRASNVSMCPDLRGEVACHNTLFCPGLATGLRSLHKPQR